MYKLGPNDILAGQPMCIFKLDANMSIPFEPDNTDYQQYLAWLEEGNTPEPAEEQQ